MDESVVNLWRAELSASSGALAEYCRLLSTAEKKYASNLQNSSVRNRYLEVRGRLRLALGTWLGMPPNQLAIDKTEHGKPYLVDYPELSFSLSHCANTLVVAAGSHCLLGVDIEQCKPRANLTGLVSKCLAKEEKVFWYQLPESERLPVFYRFWTRKEAFVKATGLGIKLGLNRCVVNPGDMSVWLRIPENYGEANHWQIQAIEMPWPLQGALVCKKLGSTGRITKFISADLPKL